MKCPVDKSVMMVLEHRRIELDYCLKCSGVWLVISTTLVGLVGMIRVVILSDLVGVVRVTQLGSIIILQIAHV